MISIAVVFKLVISQSAHLKASTAFTVLKSRTFNNRNKNAKGLVLRHDRQRDPSQVGQVRPECRCITNRPHVGNWRAERRRETSRRMHQFAEQLLMQPHPTQTRLQCGFRFLFLSLSLSDHTKTTKFVFHSFIFKVL